MCTGCTATYYSNKGENVVLRGAGKEGPDLKIGGKWFDNKLVSKADANSLRNGITRAKENFETDWAKANGLSEADTRAFVDVRGNTRWDNSQAVIDDLASRELPDTIAEVRVRTSNGVVHWNRSSQTPILGE